LDFKLSTFRLLDIMSNSKKIRVGIVGGAGYTGGELLRILVFHPSAEIAFVHSNSNAGNPVSQVHSDLLGATDLTFTGTLHNDIDVLFLCVGHGTAATFLAENKFAEHIKIIDLSTDFRLKREGNNFVYGLPELQRDSIKKAKNIANPGCFATCIQLGLLPMAAKGLLNTEIHISGITGSTGAGQGLSPTSHFSWRNNNISIYKAFNHQHLNEIDQTLKQLQAGFDQEINFIPYRGNFSRGIMISTYMKTTLSQEEAYKLFEDYYAEHPFVHVTNINPDLKQVVNTNNCIVYPQVIDGKLHVISITDNLIKGASGQAVQNMNLLFGLDEREGLRLKSVGF
jgi:N-acetyl-gamma-glutamyl-phosphate reductase